MAKVYAPQQPSRYDSDLKLWIPSMNLSPAARHGEIVVLLPPGVQTAHTAPVVAALKDRMKDYAPEDAIIAVGDPSLIAAAACIAYRKVGLLRLLKWDRHSRDYILTELHP